MHTARSIDSCRHTQRHAILYIYIRSELKRRVDVTSKYAARYLRPVLTPPYAVHPGNVLEVDTWTGRVTRTVGAQFPSPSDVFACPYAGFLLVSDAAAASVCRVPTAIGIRVGDYDDEGTDAEDADDRDERHPVRYEVVGACCLLRPVGVASARSDSVAVLLAAVGNVEIAEVRFYRV